ncbi:MAG: hypothetical protein A3F67_03575 [Verrucomicrobia bacterium RIFCSPHIGHO2_12_FULL_41_10]|nr:MAG: hypothetical protein A3F67_03575 [Verrucomicrobia bacterium RIFCSPHIGHO2_12_FULL_41_10]
MSAQQTIQAAKKRTDKNLTHYKVIDFSLCNENTILVSLYCHIAGEIILIRKTIDQLKEDRSIYSTLTARERKAIDALLTTQ